MESLGFVFFPLLDGATFTDYFVRPSFRMYVRPSDVLTKRFSLKYMCVREREIDR